MSRLNHIEQGRLTPPPRKKVRQKKIRWGVKDVKKMTREELEEELKHVRSLLSWERNPERMGR